MTAGRPRGIDDAAILRATVDVIGRVGPVGLTLAAVASEVGLVPGTLVQRFGSKRGLLLALAERAAEDADALLGRVRAEHESALAALAALIVTPIGARWPRRRRSPIIWRSCASTSPTRSSARTPWRSTRLRAGPSRHCSRSPCWRATSAPGTDVAALVGSVQAIASGAGLVWALDRQGSLEQRLRQALDRVLSPYLRAHRSDDLEES